ncbi:MAG: sugar MFS transporter [Flavobacteriaceae bacterium]|nr:sugar MFS transporter [Bacteroidota bacterium]MDB2612895.1 sugar MFS transporter [Flavobacteriaceae bacterium]MDC3269378.1 sugar MFS transporter [Flavobacteriaceae bacterium]MDG1379365.1 sugar MFS transporter [Flavobacteriaceae bacterium]MDG2350312.1 sugar MFS transporter [Flavobacteriaceae bacterium]|tara:strand:- start:1312 stop:2628 length:1317 start_codon:yes stop_codon:yes gene_type:complete
MSQQKSYHSGFILLTTLFFLWGFITVLVDSLIPRLRELFTLTYAQAILVQFAFFGAYFLLSIPASYLLSKIGYKKGIILGLLTMASGCLLFYPAAAYRTFNIFLLAYFILAGGMTILQVAANPFVAVLGSEEGASSRLNLSQAFNSLGTAIAPAVGALFILSDTIKTEDEIAVLSKTAKETYLATEASAVQMPFLGLALFIFLIALIFLFAKLPKMINEVSTGTYTEAFQNKNLMLGVLGILFYVGSEVSIGSFLVNYFQEMNMVPLIRESNILMNIAETVAKVFFKSLNGADDKALLGIFVIFYWSGAMIGRFVGSYLTRIMNPGKVLGVFASMAIILILTSVSTTGLVSMWSILGVGLFNSIMFPTIFTISINGIGKLKPKGSGLLCTAIVGGAIIPFICGNLIDSFGFNIAFIFISFCYAYILWFGYKNSNITKQ